MDRSDEDIAADIRKVFAELMAAVKEGGKREISTELYGENGKYIWELEGNETLDVSKLTKF